ncbi:MAG: hypothetical protein RDU89_07095 [bacterium]|nr:hypothetical protein [bacterium]
MLELSLSTEVLFTLLAVLVLILVNAALAILRAVIDGEFSVSHVADFLRRHILPDGGTLLILALAATVHPELKAVFFVAAAAATAKYIGKVVERLRAEGLYG